MESRLQANGIKLRRKLEAGFGVRRLVAAFPGGDLSPPPPLPLLSGNGGKSTPFLVPLPLSGGDKSPRRGVCKSGDESPHSKGIVRFGVAISPPLQSPR
jgi:hypothetical protein